MGNQLFRRVSHTAFGKVIVSVGNRPFACSGIQRNRYVLPGRKPNGRYGGNQIFKSLAVVVKFGAKPPSSPTAVERLLSAKVFQSVIDLRTLPHRI